MIPNKFADASIAGLAGIEKNRDSAAAAEP